MTDEIISPLQFIQRSTLAYSSLYAAPTHYDVKMKVLDHTLNCIGNGIGREAFNLTEEALDVDQFIRWCNAESYSYGHKQTTNIGGVAIGTGDFIVVLPDQKRLHPEIVHWVDVKTRKFTVPYPNFQKEHSMVWGTRGFDFAELGLQWIACAIQYYQECRKFFENAESCKQYHYAFPRSTLSTTKKFVREMKDMLGLYPDETAVSYAYELKFRGSKDNTGDVIRFLDVRWRKERARILRFIDETIAMLQSKI